MASSAISIPPGRDGAFLHDNETQDVTGLWQIAHQGDLCWRAWDGDYVVFCERDGATHLLGAAGSVIFSELLAVSAPLESTELAKRLLVNCVPGTPISEAYAVLGELLPRLRQSGIVDQSESAA